MRIREKSRKYKRTADFDINGIYYLSRSASVFKSGDGRRFIAICCDAYAAQYWVSTLELYNSPCVEV